MDIHIARPVETDTRFNRKYPTTKPNLTFAITAAFTEFPKKDQPIVFNNIYGLEYMHK